MQISQLVQLDGDLAIVNDVQLAWFGERNERQKTDNAKLAREYKWTSEAVANTLSSLDILDRLCQSLVLQKPTNRFTCIATYGRGKSHLALALANFFGRAAGEPIVEDVLKNIAASDDVRARNARDFKERRRPFLIVRLSGDEAGGLHQQFVSGLQEALSQHAATRDARLPFWWNEALSFLDDLQLNAAELEKANAALEAHGTDVVGLREAVARNQELLKGLSVHDLCIEAHRAARRTKPDFGGEVSLSEVVRWACREFCSSDPDEDKPCGGLLVLFDEFVKFVQSYARKTGGGSLQNLLDGIADSKGVAAFLALAQIDPDVAAKNEEKNGGIASLQSLLTELNRLPQDDRFELFTSLENVLNVYLRHDATRWPEWEKDAIWNQKRWDETNEVMALFKERYDKSDRWGEENVERILTSGCFPLHPATTALLSSVTLNARVGGARTAVGFLRWAMDNYGTREVVENGQISWIRPVEIVAFFGEMLGVGQEWEQFETARSSLGNEAEPVQIACLRAILLHDVAALKPSRAGGFAGLTAILTGYREDECQSAMQAMGDAGTIRWDNSGKRWVFLPPGESEEPLEDWLSRQSANMTLDFGRLSGLPKFWNGRADSPLKSLTGDNWGLNWANSEDWAAQVQILMRAQFSASNLKKLIARPQTSPYEGLILPARGLIIHLIAASDDDMNWLRDNAARVLDEAIGKESAPMPVVLSLPERAQPDFARLLLRSIAIDEMTQGEQRDFGKSVFENVQKRYDKQVKEALEKRFAQSADFVVPAPYRERVEQALIAAGARRLSDAVLSCYDQAYGQRPPALLTQYAYKRGNSYRAGVRWVARNLVSDAIGALVATKDDRSTPAPGRDLIFSGPKPLLTHWNLVSGENYGIQEPTGKARLGWKVFDDAFAQGKSAKVLADVLAKLLAPPYGYDEISLTLLLCAWYGRNRHLLSVTTDNLPVSMDEFWTQLNNPWDCLCQIAKRRVAWARRDANAKSREASEAIALVQKNEPLPMAQAEGKELLLRAFGEDENESDTALRDQARAQADRLKGALESARQYDADAAKIEAKIATARSSNDLIGALREIGKLPPISLVPPTRPLPDELNQEAKRRLEAQVEADCAQWEKLAHLIDYRHHETKLGEIERELKHYPQFGARLETAKTRLHEARESIEAEQHDAALLSEIKTIPEGVRLKPLREGRKRLDEMQPRAASTRLLIDQAKSQVDSRIGQLEKWAEELESRSQSSNAAELQTLREEISARSLYISGAPEAQVAELAGQKVARLLETFAAIAGFERQTSAVLASGPPAVAAFQSEIAAFQTAAQTRGAINDAARNRLGTLGSEITDGAAQARTRATRWLETQKDAASNGGDPRTLQNVLSASNPWLCESEQDDLQILRATLQTRLDSDEVGAILVRFRAIKDPAKRAQCLQQLQEEMKTSA